MMKRPVMAIASWLVEESDVVAILAREDHPVIEVAWVKTGHCDLSLLLQRFVQPI